MEKVVVVNSVKDWQLNFPNIHVVSSKDYIKNPQLFKPGTVQVYNLCRSYKYQSMGYYVSLLAEARGHKATPDITTIQDFKYETIIRVVSDDLDELIQRSLRHLKSDRFVLSIYFAQNVSKQYELLSKRIYNLFQTPLLRVYFIKNKKWIIKTISPIPVNEIPEEHIGFVKLFAEEYFKRKNTVRKKNDFTSLYDLAILVNRKEKEPPSNKRALHNFIKSAESKGFYVELIEKDDYGKIPFFDALFIRETTAVNHHTYRFARKAFTEGVVCIDDHDSILKCTNKVYLAELLNKAKIPTPKTIIVNQDNLGDVEKMGFPMVLKKPDSSFSQGVVKVSNTETFYSCVKEMLQSSELLVAQEFIQTDFDWRIGVLGNKPIYACRYYMATGHWQIYNWAATKKNTSGDTEAVPLDQVPEHVISTAVKAANLIGNGLYGVDLKEKDNKTYIIEINDNPSIDEGYEDLLLGQQLYDLIIDHFIYLLEKNKEKKLVHGH